MKNWFEDWEYPNDHIYAMERQKDIEASWQQWEENNKNKLPAIIKVIKPIEHEVQCESTAIRGTHQKRL